MIFIALLVDTELHWPLLSGQGETQGCTGCAPPVMAWWTHVCVGWGSDMIYSPELLLLSRTRPEQLLCNESISQQFSEIKREKQRYSKYPTQKVVLGNDEV